MKEKPRTCQQQVKQLVKQHVKQQVEMHFSNPILQAQPWKLSSFNS